jgi:hypothetical protein
MQNTCCGVNVKDFGAKGDGTTNDTDAINTALKSNPGVMIPPGVYRIDGTLEVYSHLHLCAGATLIRKRQYSECTEPVVLLTNLGAGGDGLRGGYWDKPTLTGSGWVKTENESPRGVVCVGPKVLSNDKKDVQHIGWTRIDGIRISWVTTDPTMLAPPPLSVGLNLDSSEGLPWPESPQGSNYNGSFSNILVQNVAVGVKIGAECNAHTFSNIFFYLITKYCYQSTKTRENTFFGGFTHFSPGVTVIKLEGCWHNLFYVQGEPGGGAPGSGPASRYFDVQDSGYCQIIGPDVCPSAPINNSETLTSLSMGVLWVPNLALRSPDEGGTLFESNFVRVPGNTAKQTWTLPNASGVVAFQADVQALQTSIDQLRTDLNILVQKLRSKGVI